MKLHSKLGRVLLALSLMLFYVPNCAGYSILTHEAIIDAAWKDGIEPLLLKRFPNATSEDLLKAHAYAYGGAIIQDLGYYPFGNRFFSDLAHYVRSGDFVQALIEESRDLNEYAFALGALAHYAGDNSGHRLATNLSVAILYPGLAHKYGPAVTYEDKPSAHMKVEYGFDVDQVAKGHYAPKAYHDFIGFEVSKPVLERAFTKTYSLDLSSVFSSVDLAIGSYRHAISTVIPRMTKVAWHLKRDEIQHSDPSETKDKFIYHISNSGYQKEWGHIYETPGFWARLKASFLRVLPKVGPLSGLAFHPPTPEVEHLFMGSFNDTLDRYRELLRAQQQDRLQLPDDNLDTGETTSAAEYRLTDETYAALLRRVSGKPVSNGLRQDILSYYSNLEKPYATKKNPEEWEELIKRLDELKSTPVSDGPEGPKLSLLPKNQDRHIGGLRRSFGASTLFLNQKRPHLLPVFSHGIVNNRPALQERRARRFRQHNSVGALPHRHFADLCHRFLVAQLGYLGYRSREPQREQREFARFRRPSALFSLASLP